MDDSQCSKCQGQGTILCDQCHGTGNKRVPYLGVFQTAITCELCFGSGSVECSDCQGSGLDDEWVDENVAEDKDEWEDEEDEEEWEDEEDEDEWEDEDEY